MEKTVSLGSLISSAPLIRCKNNVFPVLSMTMHDGIVLQSDRFKKNLASLDQSNYKVVQRGQLVVGFPIDEGVLYIQSVADAGIMSPAYNVWNVDVDKISPRFLELSLHSPMAMQYYRDNLRGTTARRRNIPTEILLALPLILPPMKEQQRIVSSLDKLTSLISLRKQQLAKLDELVKARFVEMFGEPVCNSKKLPTERGENFFKLSNGKFVPESRRFEVGIPAYGGNGISWYTDDTIMTRDTLVVGRVGFQSGNVHFAKGPLWITDNAMYISDYDKDKFDLFFLYSLMEHIDFTRFQDAGDLKKITQKPFMNMEYIMPLMPLQREYVAFAEQTNKSKLTIQQSLDKLEVLKKSLMQEYFG